MKKYFIILCLFAFVNSNLFSQQINWEIINIGLGFGTPKDSKNRAVENDASFTLGTSIWMDILENEKLSTGIDFTFTGWNRLNSDLNQKSFITLLFADYNYSLSKLIVFGGGGIGYSAVIQNNGGDSKRKAVNNIALSPRIGIKYKRMKLTCQYNYQGNDNDFFNVKIGYLLKL